MRLDENWMMQPDHDSDQVVPASYREVKPQRTAFSTNGHEPSGAASLPPSDDHATNDDAPSWIVGTLMTVYNG